jgi:hypothetical protein
VSDAPVAFSAVSPPLAAAAPSPVARASAETAAAAPVLAALARRGHTVMLGLGLAKTPPGEDQPNEGRQPTTGML